MIFIRLEEQDQQLSDFDLPNELKDFTKITKTATSESTPKEIKKVLKSLLNHSNLQVLQFWIQTLKDQNRKVDLDQLKELTASFLQ